jgi:PTH2 family peptidyl-tRNA hydrolase
MEGEEEPLNSIKMRYKLVLVIRTDLQLSKGKLAVQVAHAAVLCSLEAKKKRTRIFNAWLNEGQKKVVIKVKTLDDLLALKIDAKKLGIISCLVQDAGLTEVPPDTITCLGLGPAETLELDRLTGNLPLL